MSAATVNGGLPQFLRVGFTGHRKLAAPEITAVAIAAALDRLTRHGALVAVTSAASGADTLFLEAAAARGVPCEIILPFDELRFERDFTPETWARVQPHLAAALHVERLPPETSENESYHEAGLRTVEECDVVMAVLDEARPAGGRGGTRDVVAYARAIGRPIVLIHPDTGATSSERLPAVPQVEARSTMLPTRVDVDRAFTALDSLAVADAPRARYLVFRIILLHLLAACVAVMSLALHWEHTAAKVAGVVKLLALLWALVLAFWHRRAHHGWLHTRLGAEWCRSFLALWSMPRDGRVLPAVPSDEQATLFRVLRAAWYADRSAAKPLDGAREDYLRDRVDEQLRFYQSRAGRSGNRYLWLKRVSKLATVAAIVAAALSLALTPGSHAAGYAKLFSILMPLAAAAVLSLAVAQDLQRRGVRFSELSERLLRQRRRLENVHTWPGLRGVVHDTERMLLAETREWHSLLRFGGEH